MAKYELGIYKVIGYNDMECKEVLLTNATWDECLALKDNTKLNDNEVFDVSELDSEGNPNGSSWTYLGDGTIIEARDLYEHFGFEE